MGTLGYSNQCVYNQSVDFSVMWKGKQHWSSDADTLKVTLKYICLPSSYILNMILTSEGWYLGCKLSYCNLKTLNYNY